MMHVVIVGVRLKERNGDTKLRNGDTKRACQI